MINAILITILVLYIYCTNHNLPLLIKKIIMYLMRYKYNTRQCDVTYRVNVLETMLQDIIDNTHIMDYCWASYGTLLGIKRNNKLLPHDYDIDLACHTKYFDTVCYCMSTFVEKHPKYEYLSSFSFGCRYLRLRHKESNLYLDIDFYKENPNTNTISKMILFPSLFIAKDDILNTDDVYPLKTANVTLNNKPYKINVPNNTDNILTLFYGHDFIIPKENEFNQYCKTNTLT